MVQDFLKDKNLLDFHGLFVVVDSVCLTFSCRNFKSIYVISVRIVIDIETAEFGPDHCTQ